MTVDGVADLEQLELTAPTCEVVADHGKPLCGKPATWLAVLTCGCDWYECEKHHRLDVRYASRYRRGLVCTEHRYSVSIAWAKL